MCFNKKYVNYVCGEKGGGSGGERNLFIILTYYLSKCLMSNTLKLDEEIILQKSTYEKEK